MNHIVFEKNTAYKVAILIKDAALRKQELEENYVTKLVANGFKRDEIVAFSLDYDGSKKPKAKTIKEYLTKLLVVLQDLEVKYLYVADGEYFKALTKVTKVDVQMGYVLPCAIAEFTEMNVVAGINYQALFFNPDYISKLDLGINALVTHNNNSYTSIGAHIIHSAYYPETNEDIKLAFTSLHKYPEITMDIEAFSLEVHKAGIGSIAAAWDQHNGFACLVDYKERLLEQHKQATLYGYQINNHAVKEILLEFLLSYKGTITWHNASYDLKVIIYELYMQRNFLNYEGMLNGLLTIATKLNDTKIIAYLATNSCAGNELGLKVLAHEFAGNWGNSDIVDIRKIPKADLLKYNLIDCLSTWFVKNKYTPIMLADNQKQIYDEIMIPSVRTLLQAELVGMPISLPKVAEAKAELETIKHSAELIISGNPIITKLEKELVDIAVVEKNAKLKTKVVDADYFSNKKFNPGSPKQLQHLLYSVMQLPVIDYTKTKLPATGAETVEKLINHVEEQDSKDLLAALIQLGKAEKILSTFIPAFENAVTKENGTTFLFGNFNIGGTVSGRLSSSNPNLQNLPSGSLYGKLVKKCFVAPVGWIFCGADFNSLEDYVSALTTKDPNKLDVYIRGFDGHCLRAAYYFRDQLMHIDLSCPTSVNSIAKEFPQLRQDSKTPTFLLTYRGTFYGLMNNLGWAKDKSITIETNYHALYIVSDQYVEAKLKQASKDGYVTVAFGLRVRTPLLQQVVFNSPRMPYEAASEGRTAGNALGQSYGLLNNRAANAFMAEVYASPYRLDILPVALIHDAIYLIIRDDINVVHWVNKNLIKAMQWQELPELMHDTVKLGAALDLFHPSWNDKITLPNNATKEEILNIIKSIKE